MVFGRDMDAWQRKGKIEFQEKTHSGSFLSAAEIKLLAIAGAGFFMDSYDLFIINMVVPILIKVYYPHRKTIPWGLSGGVLKASANMGNVIGQIGFGLLGDSFGRQFVYGKECVIIICALTAMVCAPNSFGGTGITVWITAWRVVMGIGIGGDYPMSAAVVADRANLRRRGALLTLIFSAQGWGALVGAILALVVIGSYYHRAYTEGHIHTLSGAWRLLLGFGLIPACAVLYFRLTMAESLRFKEARKLQDNPDLIYEIKGVTRPSDTALANAADSTDAQPEKPTEHGTTDDEVEDEMIVKNTAFGFKPEGEKAHHEFLSYFSEWRHLKILIGTCMTWFLVDIAFYGINLNQAFILEAIQFTAKQPYRSLLNTAVGNLIIIAAGYFPGYYFTVGLIEVMGRNVIQIMGFVMTAILLLIAGVGFHNLRQKTAPFFIVFTLLQFFFNFGANSTTFVIPAEVFPSRIRTTAHGISAAVGKLGAIIAALGFVELAKRIGTGDVLLIFMGVSLAAIPFCFMIPETTGRDADLIDREELLAAANARGGVAAKDAAVGADAAGGPAGGPVMV